MLKRPLLRPDRKRMLGEVLKSWVWGRLTGRWDGVTSRAGEVWAVIGPVLRAARYPA